MAHRMMTPPSRRSVGEDRELWIFFCLAFGLTWGLGGVALLTGEIVPGRPSLRHPLYYVAAFGPSVAGIVMTARTEGWSGVRKMIARVRPRWSSGPWYVAAVIGFPMLNLVSAWLVAPAFLGRLPPVRDVLVLLPMTLVADTGPLGEEFGWRGFALPRLLERQRPLAAALVLGAIWWAWHLPTFFIPALSQSQLSMPLFVVNVLALSVIMTWLYRRTGGDLLLMILVHVAANYCGWIGVPFTAEVMAEVACAIAIVACGGLR